MAELTQGTQELIRKYQLWKSSLKPRDGATIHVDEVASKVAAFYEQIRTIIDWKEEHLMRRAAIIRKLTRRFADLNSNTFTAENFAEPLVMEFIRGGYFPNDKIEEVQVPKVQKIIEKYVFILKNNPEDRKNKDGLKFYDRLLEIAACEIEETLAPSLKEIALIDFMFENIRTKIKVSENIYNGGLLKKEDTDIQIYIAVQQALFKLDEPIISYNLLKYKFSYWDNPNEEELFKISQNIHGILSQIGKDLTHPLAKKFYNLCEKYDTPYLLLGDILISEDLERVKTEIQDPVIFEKYIKDAYKERLADLSKRIRRAAVYSTVSIFVTKILSLVILQLIVAKISSGRLDFTSLAIDVIIPTVLMALLVFTIKSPSKKNMHLAVMETIKIAHHKEKQDVYEIKMARKRGLIMRLTLSLFYLAGACISFGFIFWIFNFFHFHTSSIIINTIFIALILFAGTALQRRAQELTIEEETEGFLSFITDVLFLPITAVGRWISGTWKQYNAVNALLNALVDMPFSTFVEFLERWRYFIKERKEDMR